MRKEIKRHFKKTDFEDFQKELVKHLANGKKIYRGVFNNKMYCIKTRSTIYHEDKTPINVLEMEKIGSIVAEQLNIPTPKSFLGTLDGEQALFIDHFNQYHESFAVVPYGRLDREWDFTFNNIQKIMDMHNCYPDSYDRFLEGCLFDILIGNSKREKNSLLFLCDYDGRLRVADWITNEVAFCETRSKKEFKDMVLEVSIMGDTNTITELLDYIKKSNYKIYDNFLRKVKDIDLIKKIKTSCRAEGISDASIEIALNFLNKRLLLLRSLKCNNTSIPDTNTNLSIVRSDRHYSSNYKVTNDIVFLGKNNFQKIGPRWSHAQKFNAQLGETYYHFKHESRDQLERLIAGDLVAELLGLDVTDSMLCYFDDKLWYASVDHYNGKKTSIAYRSSFIKDYTGKTNKITVPELKSTLLSVCKNNDTSRLVDEMVIFDLLIGNNSRRMENIFIQVTNDGLHRLAPLKSNRCINNVERRILNTRETDDIKDYVLDLDFNVVQPFIYKILLKQRDIHSTIMSNKAISIKNKNNILKHIDTTINKLTAIQEEI